MTTHLKKLFFIPDQFMIMWTPVMLLTELLLLKASSVLKFSSVEFQNNLNITYWWECILKNVCTEALALMISSIPIYLKTSN